MINNAANILTDIPSWTLITSFQKNPLNPTLAFHLPTNFLSNKKETLKRAFIKSRNLFLKSALNAIFKTIKKQIKSHRSADIKKGIQSLQLSNDPKRWITLKKEMGYPRIGNTPKMKFSITDFFSKCDQIRTFPRI